MGANMNVELVKEELKEHNLLDNYIELEQSSATVELAAQALGCKEGEIAKTLSLKTSKGPIVIVVMGTARLDNKKFKATFQEKAKFLQGEEVFEFTGHPIGGVCPFGLKDNVQVFLDESLKKFDIIYPAAGAKNNAVKISLDELAKITGGNWVDVCSVQN